MPDLLRTLLDGLGVYRPALTEPGFRNLVVIFVGWVLTSGQHAVTQALVVTSVAGRRHHEAFHRFFSRGTWDPDRLAWWLFQRMKRLFQLDQRLRIAIDDTLAPKKGPHVFGIGSHIDAVRSTRSVRVFCFGHCWVMLSVLVTVPFSQRPWALPILFRLYRNKKECLKKRHRYRKKTELACELLEIVHSWVGDQRVEIAADSAYCNDTVTRGLPTSFVLFGAMRPDAVLTALPDKTIAGSKGGRPRKRGDLLPKPQALARDDHEPWKTCEAHLYGRTQRVRYKELYAQWYRACGVRLLRIIVVKVSTGTIGLRVFFCTDATLSVRDILEGYAGRWSIETCFRNLKQLLGFADSSARKREAVERVAPFVGLAYTLLVVWFVEHACTHPLAAPPVRPWYRHKEGFAFSDVLRTAQRVLAPLDVLDPRRSLDDLHRLAAASRPPSRSRSKRPTKCAT
jgi:DDE superfamily endonuclease